MLYSLKLKIFHEEIMFCLLLQYFQLFQNIRWSYNFHYKQASFLGRGSFTPSKNPESLGDNSAAFVAYLQLIVNVMVECKIVKPIMGTKPFLHIP